MIEDVLRLLAVGMIAVVIAVFVKKTSPDLAFLLTLGTAVTILLFLLPLAENAIRSFDRFFSEIGLSLELFLPLFKTIVLAILVKTGADICRDAGESAIGNLLEFGGSCAAILLAVPLFSAAWEFLEKLL